MDHPEILRLNQSQVVATYRLSSLLAYEPLLSVSQTTQGWRQGPRRTLPLFTHTLFTLLALPESG